MRSLARTFIHVSCIHILHVSFILSSYFIHISFIHILQVFSVPFNFGGLFEELRQTSPGGYNVLCCTALCYTIPYYTMPYHTISQTNYQKYEKIMAYTQQSCQIHSETRQFPKNGPPRGPKKLQSGPQESPRTSKVVPKRPRASKVSPKRPKGLPQAGKRDKK